MKIYFTTLLKKWSRQPKGQFPTGTRAYKGFQGSGKTLSMVFYALELLNEYPTSVIYTNVKIKGIPEERYNFIDKDEVLLEGLTIQKGRHGVILLLDEAHLFFNKKKGISLDILTAISQQRKDRRKLIISSQIWEDLDISLRKQVKEVVNCKNFFNKLQINTIHDGEDLHWDKNESAYVARKLYTEIWKHNDELYKRYDTYQKIINNTDYSREIQGQTINNIEIKNKVK